MKQLITVICLLLLSSAYSSEMGDRLYLKCSADLGQSLTVGRGQILLNLFEFNPSGDVAGQNVIINSVVAEAGLSFDKKNILVIGQNLMGSHISFLVEHEKQIVQVYYKMGVTYLYCKKGYTQNVFR